MSVFNDPQSRPFARLSGALYLSVALIGPFAILYVPSQIHIAGDALATAQNLVAQRSLFIAGMGGDALIMLIELMLSAMFYFMFKPINPTLSAAAALARFMETAVMAAMMLFSAAALTFADPATAPIGFDDAQRAGMADLMLNIHDAGVWVWQIFFTLHLLILGQLVARSGKYPRVLGHVLSFAGFGYLFDSLHSFAFPASALLGTVTAGLLTIIAIAETAFALWLLALGPRTDSATAFATE